jgi:ferredoxin
MRVRSFGRGEHGANDFWICPAAAQVAAHPATHVILSGVRLSIEQCDRRQDLPRRTKAALERVVLDERLLHRVKLTVARQTFDCRDLSSVAGGGERETGVRRRAVDQDRTRAALAATADELRSREVQALAERRQQPLVVWRRDLVARSVDDQAHATNLALSPRFAGARGTSMPYVITEACIGVKDRACVDVCPVDCIYEGDQQLFIHPDECIDCGACEPECPVTAIFPEEDVPGNMKQYVQINREVFKGENPPGRPTR